MDATFRLIKRLLDVSQTDSSKRISAPGIRAPEGSSGTDRSPVEAGRFA
jgi:hypothetical protein